MSENKDRTNVMSNRNYRLMFLEGLVSEIGQALYSFAVSFYILDITGNDAFLQGLFVGACSAAMLIAMPFGGVLGDRNNKVRIITACDLIKGALLIVAALFMVMTDDRQTNMTVLFAVGILGSALTGIFSPASSALLPYIVDEDQLQQATSYTFVRTSLTGILGAALAGVLYAALPMPALFISIGICYIISGISAMFIRYEDRASGDRLTLKLFFSDMKDGFGYLRSQKALMILIGAVVFINFFASPLGSNFIPYFIRTDIAGTGSYIFDSLLSPEMWSSVFSIIMSVSALVTSAVLSTREQKDKCGRSIARHLAAVGLLMVAITACYWILVGRGVSLNAFIIVFCLGCIILEALIVFVNIPINTVIMRMVDREMLSKVSGITSTLSQCMIPLSSVAAGLVIKGFGMTILLAMCSVGYVIIAVKLLMSREIEDI